MSSLPRRSSQKASGRSGSLWRQSVNFRRLGYTALGVALLFMVGWSGIRSTAVNTPNQTGSGNTAQYQPPSNTFSPAGTPPNGNTPIQLAAPPGNGIDNYPLAQNTWGDTLNPTNQMPTSGFDVYYINTNQPTQVIARSHSNRIAINYAWADFYGIPSEDFGGYWVGKLNVPTTALYQFAIDQSWAKTRIIIDRRVIFEGGGKDTPTIELSAGTHTLEVEYINNWHTTGFQLTVETIKPVYTPTDLTAAVAGLNLPANTVVYAVGVYESRNADNRISLQAPATGLPYLLMLSSYNAVNWEVSGRSPVAVIYNQSKQGSTVGASGQPPILAWEGSINYSTTQDTLPSCHCVGGRFHCESDADDLSTLNNNVRQWTGFPLVGVSGKYGATALIIPEKILNQQTIAASQNKQRQIDAQRQACTDEQRKGFEQIMPPGQAKP